MPDIGEIKIGSELGYKNAGSVKFAWTPCIDCGKPRWVLYTKGKPAWLRCRRCGGRLHPHENKADNRYPENLQLVTDDRHKQITLLETKIARLTRENIELKSRLKSNNRRELVLA